MNADWNPGTHPSRIEIAPSSIDVLPLLELNDEHRQLWHHLQQSNNACAGPLFSYDFVRAVAETRGDVDTAVLHDGGDIVGFFPFHRRGRIAGPVAGRFSDYQGTTCLPGVTWRPRSLLAAAGLKSLRFSNHLASESALLPFHWRRFESPWIDLADGFEAYRRNRRDAGRSELQEALRKGRKVEREVARTRFDVRTTDPSLFDTLIQWKRAHLEAQRMPDGFLEPWTLPLLARVARLRSATLSGLLSAWYIGDEPAAISLGLVSNGVLHGWVMAYNRKFSRYSPGSIMLVRLAEAAEALGVKRIEMGAGDEAYKRRFATGFTELIRGSVHASRVAQRLTHHTYASREALRGTKFEAAGVRLIRRIRYLRARLRRTQ